MYLQTRGAALDALIEHKVVYIFRKTNLILDPEVIYKDRYGIEYVRVPKEIVSTYYYGGLPLFDVIGGVRAAKPALSAQSHPQVRNFHQPNCECETPKKASVLRHSVANQCDKNKGENNKMQGYTEQNNSHCQIRCYMYIFNQLYNQLQS